MNKLRFGMNVCVWDTSMAHLTGCIFSSDPLLFPLAQQHTKFIFIWSNVISMERVWTVLSYSTTHLYLTKTFWTWPAKVEQNFALFTLLISMWAKVKRCSKVSDVCYCHGYCWLQQSIAHQNCYVFDVFCVNFIAYNVHLVIICHISRGPK